MCVTKSARLVSVIGLDQIRGYSRQAKVTRQEGISTAMIIFAGTGLFMGAMTNTVEG